MSTVRIKLTSPHWDSEGRLYRPGERDVPTAVAVAWGYVDTGEAAPQNPEGGPVDSDLPADFPGRDALIAAGYLTIEAVQAIDFAAMKVPGVGKATVAKITEAFAE